MAERLIGEVFTAFDEQTVVVAGTDTAALIVPSLADSLTAVLDQRKLIAARIEDLLEIYPLSQVLMSLPGIGIRTGARILINVGDGANFPTTAHLAAYAGLAPTTRSSGTSIRGEQQSRRGDKQLKRAFFLSAFATLAHPASRSYYDKEIKEESITRKSSSASLAAEQTSSSRCSATAPSVTTKPDYPLTSHRGHPRQGPGQSDYHTFVTAELPVAIPPRDLRTGHQHRLEQRRNRPRHR